MALAIGKLGGYAVYMTGPDATGQGVKVGGKTVCFDFSERFGPLVVNRYGEPIDRQPVSEQAAFWGPFEVWLAGYWAAKGAGRLAAYVTANRRAFERRELRYPGRSHPNSRSQDASIPSAARAGNPATDDQIQAPKDHPND